MKEYDSVDKLNNKKNISTFQLENNDQLIEMVSNNKPIYMYQKNKIDDKIDVYKFIELKEDESDSEDHVLADFERLDRDSQEYRDRISKIINK